MSKKEFVHLARLEAAVTLIIIGVTIRHVMKKYAK